MDPITALGQIGSLVQAAHSVVNGINTHSASSKKSNEKTTFAEQMQQALNNSSMQTVVSGFMQARDTDKNGTLNPTELGASKQVFEQMDTNKDGQVSQLEIVAALTRANSTQTGSTTSSAQ